ncbi:hypothetical protein ACEPAF_3650 [Sanghuangporus sanghuang]
MSLALSPLRATLFSLSNLVLRPAPTWTFLRPAALLAPFSLAIPSWSSLLELFPSIVLAVPKKKVSHSRKAMRSAHKGLRDKSSVFIILFTLSRFSIRPHRHRQLSWLRFGKTSTPPLPELLFTNKPSAQAGSQGLSTNRTGEDNVKGKVGAQVRDERCYSLLACHVDILILIRNKERTAFLAEMSDLHVEVLLLERHLLQELWLWTPVLRAQDNTKQLPRLLLLFRMMALHNPGMYNEQLLIDRSGSVTLYGCTTDTMDYSKNQVVITHSESQIEAGSDDESGILRIKSDNVSVYDSDVRNDYSESGKIAQAIVVSANGIQFGAYACRFFSYQDILSELFNAFFEGNTIASKGAGYITANGRPGDSDSSIYVFNKNDIVASSDAFTNVTSKAYLGRSWSACTNSSTYFQGCLPELKHRELQLNSAIWSEWSSPTPDTDHILFAEYTSQGSGVANANRPSFANILSESPASQYIPFRLLSVVITRIGVTPLARSASSQARGLQSILEKRPDDVVITFAARTAMGKVRKGQFKDHPVDEILLALFKASFAKTKLDPAKIDDVCVGTCHPPSPLYVSRAAAITAGIPAEVPISTVNRLCSSGLMSVRNIAHSIQAGEASLGIGVGAENMTLNPRPTPGITSEVSKNSQATDCVQPMGWTSEMVAKHFGISREKQDHYALISHTRAEKAQKAGIFKDEIIPIDIEGKTISEDDTIRPGVTAESLAGLKPVFPDWGNSLTTAGNASGIGDGAALCVLTTRERAEKEGMEILAKWVTSTVVGVEPRYMGIAPIPAINKILEQSGLRKEDVDTWEINEAFASQFAYCVEQLGIPIEKINVNGGAIALTHPLGMTGTRQIVTGLAQLRRQNGQILCTSMCIGSGMGAAAILINEAR